MNEEILDLLSCPEDGFWPLRLEVRLRSGGRVQEGEIHCSSCGRQFCIRGGIPTFLQMDSGELAEIKRREIGARDKSYHGYHKKEEDTLDEWERYPELDALQAAIQNCHGLTVLDAGCGVGKMTQLLRDSARIAAIDFSFEGLRSFGFRDHTRLDLIQADVCRLPLRENSFDLAISSQVLEHIPSQALRAAFFAQLARVLKPGGRLVLSVYNWGRNRSERGVPKEGFHRSDIFYHCYVPEELRAEMEVNFHVHDIWGVQVVLPKTYRLVRALGKHCRYWDRLWRKKPIALAYSSLLMAICTRR